MTIKKTMKLGRVDGFDENARPYLAKLELEIRPAQGNGRTVDLKPRPDDAVELSICGNIWMRGNTNSGSIGQNIDEIRRYFGNPKIQRICEIWDRYHLNDMKSGTLVQDAALDAHKAKVMDETGHPWRYDYTAACEVLRSAGLYEDRGYCYGSAWLYEPIPDEILAEIKTLFGVE